MTTRALFVSDIHISRADDPRARLFTRFLEKALTLPIDQLFLVGDIFDFWIADRGFQLRAYADIIALIRRLIEKGVRVHYFEGNHDLDLVQFWKHQLGADVHSEAAFFNIGSLLVRVEHGDQMDPGDRGYLFLRWLLRTPILVWLGRKMPERLVKWIGERASHASRDYTTQIKTASDDEARAKIRAHAARMHAQRPFDLLVSGHLHVQEDGGEIGKYRSINLGTWLKEPMVLEIQGRNLSLKTVDGFLNEN